MGEVWVGVGAKVEDIRGREKGDEIEVGEFMDEFIQKIEEEMEKEVMKKKPIDSFFLFLFFIIIN